MAEGQNPLRSFVEWVARSPVRAFLVVFVTAFAVRSAMLPFLPPKAVMPHTDRQGDRAEDDGAGAKGCRPDRR